MQITFAPTALPGHCFFCRSSNREWFFDTEFSLDYEGAVYVCDMCFREMASLVRWVSPEDYAKMQQDVETLSVENIKLSTHCMELQNAIQSMVSAGYNYHPDRGVSRTGGALLEAPEPANVPISVGEDKLGEGEGTSSKQDNDEGMAELHSDADSDAAEFKFDFE